VRIQQALQAPKSNPIHVNARPPTKPIRRKVRITLVVWLAAHIPYGNTQKPVAAAVKKTGRGRKAKNKAAVQSA
jgi:hypothetical protein